MTLFIACCIGSVAILGSIGLLATKLNERHTKASPEQDYSWMDNDQMAEWEALRAIEMALFDADAKPVNNQIFHKAV